MAKYLNETGLATLWNKIKSLIPTKISDLTNDSGYITNATVPTATTSKSGTTTTLTVTDKNGTTTSQILDGAKGDTGDSGVYVGASEPTGDENVWIDTDGDPDSIVTDVQINGSSAVTDGVANIPKASTSNLGVITTHSSEGLNINANAGIIFINDATSAQIKSADSEHKPVTTQRQHESTFYGLAKAAGDTTQAQSSNAVGTFTDEAKVAIQKMLGIYQAPWELIREDRFTNETEADHTITVDSNGNAFELTDVAISFETPKQSTDSEKGAYGQILFYYNNQDTYHFSPETGAWTQAAGTPGHGVNVLFEQKNNIVFVQYGRQTTTSNSGNLAYRYGSGFTRANGIYEVPSQDSPLYITKVVIPKVTGTGHYKLYGRRRVV